MKKQSLLYWFVAFVCAALIFTGCPQDADDDDTEEVLEPWLTAGSVFKLETVTGSGAWLSVKSGGIFGKAKLYSVPEAPLAVLKAVYEANGPASIDSVESDKKAVPYTAVLSAGVLSLFQFTTGTGDDAGNIVRVEITGKDLPAADIASPVASKTNLIVIDIGIPDGDNSGLPTFYIPYKGLGEYEDNEETVEETGDYSHIRLRVNRGAYLVIESDNGGYINKGSGNPSAPGNFRGGCVEVLAGGRLRDGAYEGFPLGANAVLLNLYDSYLAVGPEPISPDAINAKVSGAYNKYYAGWLLGPAAAGTVAVADQPKIQWDPATTTGNTADSYLEVRPSEIATDARLTLKRSIGLIYSVWFVDNAALTIDILAGDKSAVSFTVGEDSEEGGEEEEEPTAYYGLASNAPQDSPYKFTFHANVPNGGTPTAITIKAGSSLDKRFLIASQDASGNGIFTASDLTKEQKADIFLTAGNADIVITGSATGSKVEYSTDTGISGYPAWNKPAEESGEQSNES